MDTQIIIPIALAVLFIGSVIAIGWWGLVKRIAPYRDELDALNAHNARKTAAPLDTEVIILTPPLTPSNQTDANPRTRK